VAIGELLGGADVDQQGAAGDEAPGFVAGDLSVGAVAGHGQLLQQPGDDA
jgi:hypothetical protein